MTWTERRTFLLKAAETEPGWGCVKMVHERNVGRVVMTGTRIGPRWYRPGFYPVGAPEYVALGHYLGAKQRKTTKELPK